MLDPRSRATPRVSYCPEQLNTPPPPPVSWQRGCRSTVHRWCPTATPAWAVSTMVGSGPVWAATRTAGGAAPTRPKQTVSNARRSMSHLEPLVVHHQATIHDERDARCGSARRRRLVHDADLQPDQAWLERNRLAHNRTRELAAPKHVHHVDRARRRRRGERRVAPLAQQGAVLGVHRYDAVARLLEVARHLVARPPWLG